MRAGFREVVYDYLGQPRSCWYNLRFITRTIDYCFGNNALMIRDPPKFWAIDDDRYIYTDSESKYDLLLTPGGCIISWRAGDISLSSTIGLNRFHTCIKKRKYWHHYVQLTDCLKIHSCNEIDSRLKVYRVRDMKFEEARRYVYRVASQLD